MPASTPPPPPDGSPRDETWRWMRMTNGIVTIIVGFVVFGLGVGYGLGPLEILAALIIVAGGIMLVRALIATSRD